MAETFELQLADAWREDRWLGMVEIWFYAVAEIFRIALPLQAAGEPGDPHSLVGIERHDILRPDLGAGELARAAIAVPSLARKAWRLRPPESERQNK